jgi:hypothetical protein
LEGCEILGKIVKDILNNNIKKFDKAIEVYSDFLQGVPTFTTYYNKDIVKKYNQICQSNFERIISNLKQNQELAKLRDWLLPMLMNGQVRVK